MTVDKTPQRSLARHVYPAVDPVRHDVVEKRIVAAGGVGEIGGFKACIRDPRFGGEAPRMVDMGRHRIDAVKHPARMRCRQNCGGHTLAAAEIAPGKPAAALGRQDAVDERRMVEPGRRLHRLEVAQIRDIAHIAVQCRRHRPILSGRDPKSMLY